MKRLSFRRRNAIFGTGRLIGPVSLSILGVVVLFFILRTFVPGSLAILSSPFWSTGTMLTASVGNTGTFFTDKATLAKERDALRDENALLRSQQQQSAAREADLMRLLGNRVDAEPGIIAGVLARPPVSPYDVLIVGAGSKSGIIPGMRALGPAGVPIGVVESVSGTTANVVLYSAPVKETEAWVGEARIPVTLRGAGSGAFTADVVRETSIKEGDQVYVAGPGALPIGQVAHVSSDPSSPRSSMDIKPFVNPFSITWISLVP